MTSPSAFDKWLERTDGKEPMNEEEKIQDIEEAAQRGMSFTAEDMLFVLAYTQEKFDRAEERWLEDKYWDEVLGDEYDGH